MRTALANMRRGFFRSGEDIIKGKLSGATLLEVNPMRIVLYSETPAERHKKNKYVHAWYKRRERFILPGRWDINCSYFRDMERYRFAEELRLYDFDYTRCARFKTLLERVKTGEAVKFKNKGLVFRSEEDVHSYIQGHVAVCKSMESFGYLAEKAVDHICVMVGRNGDLIKEVRGRHRLAIAQVFEVPRVVALIRHVHPIWVRKQQKRFGPLPVDEVLRRAFKALEAENQPLDRTAQELTRN